MAVLVWGNIGERYYETGVDRGVLFPQTGDGVPWNGLISVSEAPSGGEPRPYYLDGFKYLNLATAEEFAATIDAFSAPDEFNNCDGMPSIHNGLFITQQKRETFGLSYRTRIGNDVDGTDHGYKIHLVYNALTAPSSRSNSTLNDSPSPLVFSWGITTAPPPIAGFKPSAHFVIDSRKTPETLLKRIENILYGSSTGSSRLPSVDELMDLMVNYVELGPLAATFKQSTVNANNLTVYTFAGQDIGAESPSRRVIVALSTSSARTISSVTIGGIAATIDATHFLSGTARIGIVSAVVPTGTTADVVVTLNGQGAACGIGVWTLNYGDPTLQVASGSGDPISLTVATQTGDIVIAVSHTYNSDTAVFDWTNVTSRFVVDTDDATETISGADGVATGISTVVGLNPSLASTVAVVAAYR